MRVTMMLVTAMLTLATAVTMLTVAVLTLLAAKVQGSGGARECGDVMAAMTSIRWRIRQLSVMEENGVQKWQFELPHPCSDNGAEHVL